MTEKVTEKMHEKINETLNQTKTAFAEWKKLADEQWKRWDSLVEEMARYQKQGVQHLGSAIDEVAKTMKGSLEHANQMAEELRKATADASKRAREALDSVVTPPKPPTA
jgi:sugar-specific transcriptional regulator TrmB